jgi:branched-chain amino acid transport system substrate-binding protein
VPSQRIVIGLSLSLSGRYAPMGCQAEAALRMLVADVNAAGGLELAGQRRELALECFDDGSQRSRTELIYRELCQNHRANLLLSPYSSELTRAAASIADEAGILFVNHGGADDALYERGYRLIVGVLTPASEYLSQFVRLVGTLKFWRKRIAIVASPSPFAQAVARGAERACTGRLARLRHTRVRLKFDGRFTPGDNEERLHRALRRNRINVLISAGSYEYDVAVMRFAASERANIPVLGCVAAGVSRFREDLGDAAEGIVGAAQWDANIAVTPSVGPSPAEFARRFRAICRMEADYPAAQAYAAGLLTILAINSAQSLESSQIRAAFSHLRTTTLFGDFAIEPSNGRQIAHKMLLVQWHGGRKVIIEPEPELQGGELQFPSGVRMLLTSFQFLRIGRRANRDENGSDELD